MRDIIMKTKICTKCKIEKSLDEFYNDKRNKDGKTSRCKDCMKKYCLENKDKLNKQHKNYYESHKQELIIKVKKYRNNHQEEIKIYKKKHYLINQKKLKIKAKKYREEHKEEIKIYLKRNKEKINNTRAKYRKNRHKTDINFKIRCNLRTRIWCAIKNTTKSATTIKLLGCEIDYLLFHLQSQFKPGMTWDNYGAGINGHGMTEWHIDHIKPCAKFDLSKPEEQLKCFNYKNLQPLWAKDNLAKRFIKQNKEG